MPRQNPRKRDMFALPNADGVSWLDRFASQKFDKAIRKYWKLLIRTFVKTLESGSLERINNAITDFQVQCDEIGLPVPLVRRHCGSNTRLTLLIWSKPASETHVALPSGIERIKEELQYFFAHVFDKRGGNRFPPLRASLKKTLKPPPKELKRGRPKAKPLNDDERLVLLYWTRNRRKYRTHANCDRSLHFFTEPKTTKILRRLRARKNWPLIQEEISRQVAKQSHRNSAKLPYDACVTRRARN